MNDDLEHAIHPFTSRRRGGVVMNSSTITIERDHISIITQRVFFGEKRVLDHRDQGRERVRLIVRGHSGYGRVLYLIDQALLELDCMRRTGDGLNLKQCGAQGCEQTEDNESGLAVVQGRKSEFHFIGRYFRHGTLLILIGSLKVASWIGRRIPVETMDQ
jgi:hypothetical protein